MSNHLCPADRSGTSALKLRWYFVVLALLVPMAVMAAPIAVDDNVLVPSNTTVFANDLAANDTNLPTDTYLITVQPSNGTATLSPDGLLDYTPNIGFASLDTLTYSVDDGAGGIDTATVTFEVVLTSDFLTPANNFIIGQEDIPTPLNLSVDASLEFGGTLQDIIGVDALYRDENGSDTAVASIIPSGSTGINITGFATRNVGTNQNDVQNDDYELSNVTVDLREGTYSGRLTYSIAPNLNNGTIDQYTWLNVPLGQSVLTDTSFVSGNWTGAADLLIEIVAGQLRITETIPLQIAYHVQYMTADGDSTDFVSGSGDVQNPGESVSTFVIPAALEPTDGSKHGYLVLTGNSAADGSHFAEEHKGFSRLVIDLQADTVSGAIASERGELDSRVTTWAFLDYPLIDLRDTPAAIPVAITDSTATRVGDETASVAGIEDDPTIYIDASGDLIVERESGHAAAFTTMYTSENYRRTGLSSIASFVGVESDTTLFDSNPPDGVDSNGKPINIQTFAVPAISSIGIVQMSWQTFAGSSNNENVGYGFAVIDLNNNTSAGSITFSRTTTPDLVAWQSVPLGTTMFGATNGGIPLFQSNKAAGDFTDDYGETARFTLVDNPDGTRTLEFTATSNAGTGAFADYIGTTQVSWLGSEPFMVEGVPGTGVLSHGSPISGGGWEVDFADIPLLTISTNEHGTGELLLELLLSSTGEKDSITVHVEPVVDAPVLTATNAVGYIGNPVVLGISVGDSADVDGSETQLQTLDLAGVPTTVILTSSVGTVTNFGGGNWQVDNAALADLSATGTATTTAIVTVSGTNTDTDDLDGDGVIEDSNNGAGVDELDTATYQETFNLIILDVPTVTSQIANTGTPVISGTANVSADETLTVAVNGVTYTEGDGNLVDNGDGTWDLTIPAANTIADGIYSVAATIIHSGSGSGTDTTTDELTIDSSPPIVPVVTPLTTSDATPILSGTATVAAGETLNVTVDGISYTAGDGSLTDNGDGTWVLAISTPLAEGTYEVTATVTDTAGNVSVDATTNELLVQAIPLSTPTVVLLTTSDTTPAITGNAVVGSGDTLTVTVNGVTYLAGDGNLIYSSSGTWTLSIPSALADNTYEVIATVTDIFGNAFPDTSSDELVIDTTAPVVPTVTAQTTNNTTPVVSGTATVELGETLSVTVNGVTYTAGDGNLVDNGNGNWDLAIPAPLAESTYSVTATVTDAAGNSATDSTADELIIDTTVPAVPTVTFQTTSNTTPVISGSATVGAGETLTVSVGGITYTSGDGNLLVNTDGSWDLTIPTALSDGNFSVTATVTDAAGNSSDDTTALELTIDTIAPVTPTVASQSTNSTIPVITGTATVAPGDTLTVTVDGVTYTAGDGYLADNGDGTWELSVPVPLAEGSYDVTTTVTDPAGNSTDDTTASELVIDLTAPAAPGVTSLATTDTTPVIDGTATLQPGEVLSVEVDGITYMVGDGNLVDNGDGTWALTIPATNILAENLYQVIATVTDAAGNSAVDPGIDDLVVDLTAPLTPGVTSLTTNDTTPVIEGTAVVLPGETLTVTVNGTTYTAGDGNLADNGDGTWSLLIPAPINEGVYDVTATIIDSAGNNSTDPSSTELLIDTTAPLVPTTTPLVTNNPMPVISGTANAGPGEILTVTVDGVTYSAGDGDLLDNGDGTWDLAFPVPLAENIYEVTASVMDAAGNISTDTGIDELVIDLTVPVVPVVNTLTTNDTTPVISGTTSIVPGETLTVTVNGVTYTAGDGKLVVNTDGTWSLTIPAGDALVDGTYEIVATISDLAGNTSTDTTASELIVDTSPPAIPTVVAQITSNTTPILSGQATVAAGETLTVTVDGVTYTDGDGSLVDNGDGTWDLTIPAALADNVYPITVTVVDATGNASDDVTTAELTIDTTAPEIPTVVSQITNDTTPIVTGTAVVGAGETLSVTLVDFTYTTAGGDLVLNTDGTWNLNIPVAMADNVYTITATVTDAAGNSAIDLTTLELTIDTTPPVTPTVTFLTTNDPTPLISGTATVGSGETLTVTVGGTTYTTGDGFLIDNGDGTWNIDIPTALLDGNYSVDATISDAAGNISDDITAFELTIDTVPPVTPSVTPQTTNSPSPVIAGTATVNPGDTLTVTIDGVTYTAGDGYLIDNGDGTWALSVPAALLEGIYEVTTTVTDPAGNATNDTTADELIIDLTAPIAPGVTSLATTNTTPVVEGTATVQAGEVLTVEINGVTYTAGDGNLTDNGDGTWTLIIPPANTLAENLYQVLATVTDAAGNSAVDPGVDDLLVDLTAPATPGVTSLTTNDTTPVVEGTASVALGETLSVTVNGVIYVAGNGDLVYNGDGTWTLSIPTITTEGLYDVTATLTDGAGNMSTDPSSGELLIDTTAPMTPTVSTQHTSDTTPVISGTSNAGPGEILTVIVDGITYTAGDGDLLDNGDGTWDLTIPAALAEATYEVTATVTDAAGNVSTDTSVDELTIDITAPITPTVNILITNDTTPVLSGTTSTVPGETLTVVVNSATYTAGDGNLVVNADGTWELTIPSTDALVDATYEVTATITDLAGNSTIDTTASELIIDTAPPVVPTVVSQNTSNNMPVLSGMVTVDTGETLTVTVGGITYTAGDSNLVDNGDGTWNLTLPVALADNTYPVTVTVFDAAGNASNDTTSAELVIDTVAPVAPGITPLITNDTTPVISGTATVNPGETLTVTVDGVTYTAGDGNLVNNGDGTWTLSIPTPLAEGPFEVVATVTDAAGNASNDATAAELIVDITAPAIPTSVSQITNNTTPVITGTATVLAGETLTVTVSGVTYTAGDGNLVDNGDGTWDLIIPTALPEATYEVTVSVTDAAGNVSTDTSVDELTIDITAPVVPTVNTLTTNNTTPVISGATSTTPGETLSVTVNGITYTADDGNLVVNTDGTWDLTIPASLALVDGTYEVTATITDLAGNSTTDNTVSELIVDTEPPPVPTVISQNTSNTTPVLSGTATVGPGETLTVTVDGVTYTAGDGNLIDNGDGTWDLTLPAPLADNTYPVTVTVLDAAGNSSIDITSAELVVDTIAPVVPTVVAQNTSNTTPVITGTATVAPGETLTVTVGGVTYSAGDGNLIDNGDGTWTLSIPAPLNEGVYEVVATVTDPAGNSTTDVTPGELVIDTTPPILPTVESQITSNTTPLVIGTATVAPGETLSVTIDGITYTEGDGNLVDNNDGTWSLSIPLALIETTYDVAVSVTDVAGNVGSDTTTGELIIDVTAPAAPGVTSLVTNNITPVIEGTASVQPGEVLTVAVDGITYTAGDGNLTDNGDGTWTLTVPASNALAEDLYQVIATITDAAGNQAVDPGVDDLLVDLTAPVTPGVTGLTTNDTTPTIEGTAIIASGETLTVIVNAITYAAGDGSLIDNGNGTWALSIQTQIPEGPYDVTATVTDSAGNSNTDPSALELLIDTTAPVIPATTPLVTNDTTPVISGAANAGPAETLTVTVNGITYTAGDGNLIDNGDGTWDLSIPTPLAEGTYAVTTSVTDAAGNTSTDSSTDELVIDLTAPSVPVVDTQTTSDTTPIITGTTSIALGETLTVTVDGVSYSSGDGNLVVNPDGTWELVIPASNPLADDTYEIIATITDLAGNTTPDTSNSELIVDTIPPVIPSVATQITNNPMPIVSGTATVAPDETLSVTVGGVTYSTGDGNLVDNGDGTWELTLPVPLANNTYPVTATVIDTAANTAVDITTDELVIDTLQPDVPTVTAQTSNNTTPVIGGTATINLGETLTVTVNGVTYTTDDGNLIVNGDGTWTLSIPTPLPEGSSDVIATVTDMAGNAISDTTAGELVVDLTAPVAPGVTSLVTTNTTPIIEGTAITQPGEVLFVEVNGVTYIEGDGNLLNNGDGTWSLTISAANSLDENLYQVVAMVTDAAGNQSRDPGIDDLVVDLTAPSAPGVTSLTTNNTTPVIEGTATVAPGETLSVTVNGTTYTTDDGNLIDNGDGTWMLSISTPLIEGLYDVTATITDIAGNSTTDPSSGELLIDTTPPTIPTVTPQQTNDTTPVIFGTANAGPGELLTVTIDGVTYTAGNGNLIDNGDGTWALSVPLDLAEGIYDIIVSVTDAAGNETIDTSSNQLVIDITPPATPSVNALVTSDTTPLITGNAALSPGDTLTVTVGRVLYTAGDGNLIINGDGTWMLVLPTELPEGVYDVIVSVTDIAGNTTNDSGTAELIIDTTAPVPPTAESLTTTNTTPTLSGTANTAPGDSLIVTVNGVSYTAGDGNLFDNEDGTWTLNIPVALSAGTFPIEVTVTDAVGNTSLGTPADLIIQSIVLADSDNDGVPDSVDLDDDNDGIPDLVEGALDTDSDGLPDFLDLDSDNDGIADIIEVMGEDRDNDFRVDNFIDQDNNGLSDELQLFPFELVDTDNDRVADFKDLDSDNDGLTDLLESGGTDNDNNGRIDSFIDNDNNGADDESQITDPAGRDTDEDGVYNRLDLDSDNDGIFDLVESGGIDQSDDGIVDSMQDTDLDGIPDSVDSNITGGEDSDGDSIDDLYDTSVIGGSDIDADGITDVADPDANGDGFTEVLSNSLTIGEALPDNNGNGTDDVVEPASAFIKTGLRGNGGCSVYSSWSANSTDKPVVDPLLILLAATSGVFLRRRSQKTVLRNVRQ